MAKAYRELPESELLWELFEYKLLTGELVWRKVTSNRVCVGAATGSTHNQGYAATRIKGISYLTHRLVWAWIYGQDPKNLQVDHVDGNRQNNRWNNLRLATPAENARNSKVRKHNRSGIKGVRVLPSGKYQARIRKNGVTIHLGAFETHEEASFAYKKAALELHGQFAKV